MHLVVSNQCAERFPTNKTIQISYAYFVHSSACVQTLFPNWSSNWLSVANVFINIIINLCKKLPQNLVLQCNFMLDQEYGALI